MRATNHHGRGTAHHNRHNFDAPHIDRERTKYNFCWALGEKTQRGDNLNIEAAEKRYYEQKFTQSLDAQNARHKSRRQYGRIRTMDDIYRDKQQQPEESLLYIGDKSYIDDVSIDTLWKCAVEYARWEMEYSKKHGDFYQCLSLTLHADEPRGQIHVHERGVYQYQAADGWKIGQAKALELAGFQLPEPGEPRSKENNRKMTWDSVRREKWLDIIESHGYQVEREPEDARPHMGLEAWQALQDARQDLQEAQDGILAQRAKELDSEMEIKAKNVLRRARTDADKIRQHATAEADSIRQQSAAEIDKMRQELARREAIIAQKEAVLTDMGRERYRLKLQEGAERQTVERMQEAELQLGASVRKHGKRMGKIPRKEENGMDF